VSRGFEWFKVKEKSARDTGGYWIGPMRYL